MKRAWMFHVSFVICLCSERSISLGFIFLTTVITKTEHVCRRNLVILWSRSNSVLSYLEEGHWPSRVNRSSKSNRGSAYISSPLPHKSEDMRGIRFSHLAFPYHESRYLEPGGLLPGQMWWKMQVLKGPNWYFQL